MIGFLRQIQSADYPAPAPRRALRPVIFALLLLSLRSEAFSQGIRIVPDTQQDLTWWYVTLAVLVVALVLTIRVLGSRKKERDERRGPKGREPVRGRVLPSMGSGASPNRAREEEWLRSNRTETEKLAHLRRESQGEEREWVDSLSGVPRPAAAEGEEESVAFGELPVSRLRRLDVATPFEPLPVSDDSDLLNAIEQTREGTEDDEEVRLLATRVLQAFKTANSIEALNRIALQDISSNVRARAVGILAEFDHETVFETLVVASADPSRDVRAAAARGLARLSIDRADAWARIAESGDVFRIARLAEAAVECEIVARSVDRLVHLEEKVAHEAFALFILLARGGDTSVILDLIEGALDVNVKLALIHVLETALDARYVSGLVNIADDPAQTSPVRTAAESAAKMVRALRTVDQ